MKNLITTLFEVTLLLKFTHFACRICLRKILTGSFAKKDKDLTLKTVFLEYVDILLMILDNTAKNIRCQQEKKNQRATVVSQKQLACSNDEFDEVINFTEPKINKK